MATIKEIAEKAGVSRGTVDRVIHKRGRVDKDVEERVNRIIESLSYRPNRAGQTLAASKKSHKTGVVMPSLSNPFFCDIKRGMEEASDKSGLYLTFHHYTGYEERDTLKVLNETINEGVDSLLLTVPDTPLVVKTVEESMCPFGSVNSGLSSDKCLFYSGPDYRKKGMINAGLLALVSSSFQPNILFLRGSEAMKGHKEILDGFIEALDKRGVNYTIQKDVETNDDDETTEFLTSKALSENSDINTIFISTSGVKGAMRAIGEREMLVFSSDDTEDVCRLVNSGRIKWTVSQEPFLQGYNAVMKMSDYLISHEKPESFIARNIVKIKENIGEEICL
ncbi:MAG: LacI family DNA-binding transcriptional regulator [Candidatus Ornithospirochaeta sp.]